MQFKPPMDLKPWKWESDKWIAFDFKQDRPYCYLHGRTSKQRKRETEILQRNLSESFVPSFSVIAKNDNGFCYHFEHAGGDLPIIEDPTLILILRKWYSGYFSKAVVPLEGQWDITFMFGEISISIDGGKNHFPQHSIRAIHPILMGGKEWDSMRSNYRITPIIACWVADMFPHLKPYRDELFEICSRIYTEKDSQYGHNAGPLFSVPLCSSLSLPPLFDLLPFSHLNRMKEMCFLLEHTGGIHFCEYITKNDIDWFWEHRTFAHLEQPLTLLWNL